MGITPYEELIELSTDYFWSLDKNLKIRYANKAYLNLLFSATGQEFKIGDPMITPLFGEEYVEKWTNYYQQALAGELTEVIDSLYNPVTNEVEYGLTRFTAIKDENGKIGHLNCHACRMDTSAKFRSELSLLAKSSTDIICSISKTGHFLYVSESVEKNWGYDPKALIGSPYSRLVFQQDIVHTQRAIHAVMEGHEQSLNFSNKILMASGELFEADWDLRWDHSSRSLFCIIRNNGEHKRDVKQLELLGKAINNSTDAIFVNKLDSEKVIPEGITYVNPAFVKITGYSTTEIIGESPFILIGEETDKEGLKRLGQSISQNKPFELTTIHYKKNREPFWVEIRSTPLENEYGVVTHCISVLRDVTKRKLMDMQTELVQQLVHIFNQEPTLHKSLDLACQEIAKSQGFSLLEIWIPNLTNDRLKRITQFTSDQTGSAFYESSKRIDSFRLGEGLPGTVWEKQKAVIWENLGENNEFVRKEEAKKTNMETMMGIPLLYANQLVGVVTAGSFKDKFELKQSFELLKGIQHSLSSKVYWKKLASELNTTFEFAPELMGILNIEGKFLRINTTGCNLLEKKEKQILGKRLHEIIPDLTQNNNLDFLDLLNEKNKHERFETRHLSKQGELQWMEWNCQLQPDEEIIFITAKDVTKDVKTKELLDDASSLSRIGGWETDLINHKVHWSEVVHEIHQTNPKSFEPSFKKGIEFYRPDFRPMIQAQFDQALSEGTPINFEAVIITRNNKEVWVRSIGKPEFINGQCVRIYGSFQDITERKEAQLALNKAYEERNNLLGSIGDAFIAFDENWIVTYWNDEAEKLFEKKKEDILGKNIWEEYPDGVNSPIFNRYHEVKKTGENARFEYYAERLDLWLDISVFDSKSGLSVYFKDITFRKEAENKIKEANDRFKKVTEATKDAIWDWEIEKNETYMGKGFNDLIENEGTALIDSDEFWRSTIHPKDFDNVKSSMKNSLNNPAISQWEMEYRVLTVNGKIKHVLDKAVIMRNDESKAIRMLGAITDITYIREHEKELLSLNRSLKKNLRELEIAYEELEQFTFIASHDLQEPLRMITSFLDQLKRKYEPELDEKAKQYIFYATDGAKRMRQIILDLLEYSRAGKFKDEPETVNLSELIEDYKILRRRVIDEKKVILKYENLPAIQVIKTPFTQVMHNLLDNAIKYSKKDVPPEISIEISEIKEVKSQWRIGIHDNGIGIDQQFYEKIFIIFQRLHDRDQYEGSGMGLSIVKKTIESWGGRVWVESQPGKGSSFYFTINQ